MWLPLRISRSHCMRSPLRLGTILRLPSVRCLRLLLCLPSAKRLGLILCHPSAERLGLMLRNPSAKKHRFGSAKVLFRVVVLRRNVTMERTQGLVEEPPKDWFGTRLPANMSPHPSWDALLANGLPRRRRQTLPRGVATTMTMT